jgi:hypothetical protein
LQIQTYDIAVCCAGACASIEILQIGAGYGRTPTFRTNRVAGIDRSTRTTSKDKIENGLIGGFIFSRITTTQNKERQKGNKNDRRQFPHTVRIPSKEFLVNQKRLDRGRNQHKLFLLSL